MNVKNKSGSSLIWRILICGSASMLTSILLCMLIGVMVLKEVIPQGAVNGAAIGISFTSVLLCAFICAKKTGEKCMLIALAVATTYLLLCVTMKGLFFRSGLGQTIYLIPAALVAAAIAGILGAKKKKRRR